MSLICLEASHWHLQLKANVVQPPGAFRSLFNIIPNQVAKGPTRHVTVVLFRVGLMPWDGMKRGLCRAQDRTQEPLDPVPDSHSTHGRPLAAISVPHYRY